MEENKREVVLSVQNLDVVFKNGKKEFKAVDDVSFDIYKGETFSLVGESGSGRPLLDEQLLESTLVQMVLFTIKARKYRANFLGRMTVK